MVRMQVTLDEEQHRQVRERARASGLSVAEYIRRVVSADLGGVARTPTDVSGLSALGDSGGSDVARHKPDYVAAAIGSALRRQRSS